MGNASRAVGPAPAPAGLAEPFGRTALVVRAHLGLILTMLAVAAAGYGVGSGTDC
ncbi:MAG: hypothetical protein OEY41_15605 [Acidimicrobiia bacterium]|nr:hypothetical protein [Acidimicrobiia bacterium]MDH4364386.1 hypothetical protein [Acidimicrobiia bacterium]MDH5291419.1 hypothetical protein [Acidimicrobiia bacterium]